MAAERIFTAPPHFLDAGPLVPCPGPCRPLTATELAAPVEDDSSPARDGAPAASASSTDAGTWEFSDGEDEKDVDDDETYDDFEY